MFLTITNGKGSQLGQVFLGVTTVRQKKIIPSGDCMTRRTLLLGLGILVCGYSLRAQQTAAPMDTRKPAPKTVAWGAHDSMAPLVERSRDKTVWNYDGGMFLETDGSLSNGVCFRLYGRVTSTGFFDNLKRIDNQHGTIFRRGSETVTQFPDELLLSFVIRDHSCTHGLQEVGTHNYLTREMMSTLGLSLYWKHGVGLRPVKNIREVHASVDPLVPYAKTLASELPKRFAWSWELAIPSAGVPLTDSLVLVFRAPDDRIAARVAARL
jgi:hypothetical protein